MYRLTALFFLAFFLFTSCIQDKHPETKIEVTKLLETSESWNGDSLPGYPDGRPQITILKIIIPPKAKLEVHKHPVINAGVLLKGELTVVTEAKGTLKLKAGDAISELVDTWHYGVNNGTKPAEIMVFYAGVEGSPLTIYKGDD